MNVRCLVLVGSSPRKSLKIQFISALCYSGVGVGLSSSGQLPASCCPCKDDKEAALFCPANTPLRCDPAAWTRAEPAFPCCRRGKVSRVPRWQPFPFCRQPAVSTAALIYVFICAYKLDFAECILRLRFLILFSAIWPVAELKYDSINYSIGSASRKPWRF